LGEALEEEGSRAGEEELGDETEWAQSGAVCAGQCEGVDDGVGYGGLAGNGVLREESAGVVGAGWGGGVVAVGAGE